MNLPFKTQILRGSEITLSGQNFSTEEIVAKLEPHLTPSRIQRIAQVIEGRTYSIATVAEHLYDIGNISAVMRSAESFGFLPFHIVERPGSKYKMSDRISRGTEKWLDIRKHKSSVECVKELKERCYKVYATDLYATHKIEDINFSEKVAVVFGNEKEGISEEMREHADGRFIIPMHGFAQSFNISVAASLCFYHIHQKREVQMGDSGDLTPEEKIGLKAHYYLRTIDGAEEIMRRDYN
jgi:tRNA (guanosine-2'-O-)-methyltransferase